MKGVIRFFLVLAILLWFGIVPAQQKQGRTTVHIEHADYMEGSARFGKNVQALFGNVRFRHHQTLMHCDSAFFYRDSNNVHAYGSIHVIQNDTINLYGDVLYYHGNEEKAMVRENVRLVNKNVVLTTEFLDYDRRNDVAYYYGGGKITSDNNELVSDWGYYYPRTDEAHFRKEVVVTNPDYKMYSDTLLYYTIPEIIKIVGPTTIISERNEIYSEAGFYDTQKNIAQLERNSSIKGEEQQLDGDTIFYDRNTGFGEVFSNMYLHDTTNHVIITGDYGYYNELSQRALATKRAVLMQIHQNDTLFMHADTLRADPIPDTEFQMIRAYHNVKFFRPDFQGRCDSMVYNLQDSINTFYKDPVIWANKNQLSAGSIKLFTRNSALYKAELIENAFVIGPEDTASYNQIKGRNMTGYIRDNELYRIDVEGNGQTIYYPKEDGEIIGVNKAEASNMTILLEKQEVTGIILRNQPTGNLNPPDLLTREARRLDGFRWLEEYRPKTMMDIFKRDVAPEAVSNISYSDFHFDRSIPTR
jgi:lipopolysaccharide export system protein LptA